MCYIWYRTLMGTYNNTMSKKQYIIKLKIHIRNLIPSYHIN